MNDSRTPSKYFVKKNKRNAEKVVEHLMQGRFRTASALIKKELDRMLSDRYMVKSARIKGGQEMGRHIFGE